MVDAMTKSELIERLANKNARLTARDVDESVKAVLDAMTLAMATGSRIEYVPHFKAGKEMRLRVDGAVQEA